MSKIIFTSIVEIKEEINKLPTMMGLEKEKLIIEKIMSIDKKKVIDEIDLFFEITDDLLISRSTSFYNMSESDKPFFISFSEWLRDIATLANETTKDGLVDLARIYSTFPEQIRKIN